MSRNGKILVCICLWDLFSTLILLNKGIVNEGNPLLKFYLENFGTFGLASSKLFINFFAIFVFEAAWHLSQLSQQRKTFYYRLVSGGYLAFYVFWTLIINFF